MFQLHAGLFIFHASNRSARMLSDFQLVRGSRKVEDRCYKPWLLPCSILSFFFFLCRMSYFFVSFMQEDVYIGHTALALMLGLQVFS